MPGWGTRIVWVLCAAAAAGTGACVKGGAGTRAEAPARADAGEDIRIELEAASMEQEPSDGGRGLGPEDKRVLASFGQALQRVEEPMRACGRSQAHPAQGRATLSVAVSRAGAVARVEREVSPGMEELAHCMEEAVRAVRFPSSDRTHRVHLESRFDVQR